MTESNQESEAAMERRAATCRALFWPVLSAPRRTRTLLHASQEGEPHLRRFHSIPGHISSRRADKPTLNVKPYRIQRHSGTDSRLHSCKK